MSRVFPDFDDVRTEQSELGFPASRRERVAEARSEEGEPARSDFFRSQRRPVLPLLGLLGAAATVAVFLWLGREEAVPSPAAAGEELAAVAAAPGIEVPLPAAEAPSPDAGPSPESLAAPESPEANPAAPAPMPTVPSVLDESPAVEAAPAPRAKAVTEVAPAPAHRAKAAHTGGYSVQLLAGRSEADVGSSWERLRGSNPDLLASLTPSVTRTSRAQGDTFYRLRAGPLRDRASADALCKALSARQQSCFVVRPGT